MEKLKMKLGHNPCFSRNSFATFNIVLFEEKYDKVTILVLVETPLQRNKFLLNQITFNSHNPCFSGNSFATR